MQQADDNPWDEAGFNTIPSSPDPLGDISLFYEDQKTILDWCGQGAACLCGVGASHVMCFGIPIATGMLSGGTSLLIPSAAMHALSPTFAIAANAGIDRWKGVRRDAKSQVTSMAVSSVVAIGLTCLINNLTGHEHMDSARRAHLDSLGPDLRAAELVVPQQRYDRLPETLRVAVDEAARKDGLSAAEYMYFCDGSDDLGRDIAVFEREWRERRDFTRTP